MAESLIQSVIKCPICLEAYKDPRMLPCLHSFCKECLNGYIENCRMGPNQNYFTCPVCREEIYPPHPYRPLSQWSTQFRSNFIMTDLASCLTEVSKGKEEGDVTGEVCFPCSKQMPFPKEAEHFCLDCTHPYCEACMQVHMSIPSCQKHSIVAIDDHAAREHHQKQHQHCSEHPEEMLKMFCEDCCELLCPMCALMKHRQCSKLNSVTPMAAARRLHLETSQRHIINTLGKAKERQAKLKEESEALSKNITQSLREMDEAYDSLITKLKGQKKSDMLKSHEAIAKTQKHLANCEEQINVFIAVLEENMSRTQSMQLISSDVQLLQEVSNLDLKETESDIEAATSFLAKVDTLQFDVPCVARKMLEDVKQMLSRMSLVKEPGDVFRVPVITPPTAAAAPMTVDLDHTPAKLSAVGSRTSSGQPGFALQLQQERLACHSVLSTSSDISAASTSSSEGSLACGTSSDGQRNPFSFVAGGKRYARKPPARPRNGLARKVFSGPSVFSVKHPVVTAANSTVKQASPKRGSDNPGFVFVPAKNVRALFSQFKPIPKLAGCDPASDDTLLNIMPPTSPMSGAHTLPKPSLPKPAPAGEDLMLPTPRRSNTQYMSTMPFKQQSKMAKTAMDQVRKTTSNSLSVTNSCTMTSPTNSPGLAASSTTEVTQLGDQLSVCEGATALSEAAALGKVSALTSDSAPAGADINSKLGPGPTPKSENQKLRSVFKICPSSAGDLRRPILSDFAVLPNGRLAVIDRANNRVKVVELAREGQDGLCPSLDLTKPHGVCHMNGDIIAVVSHVAKTLQLVSINGAQLSMQHIHNTCRGYLNIARLSPTILAARFSLGVHVLDVGGPALRLKVAIVNDSNGKPLFQSPTSMCTTQDGKIVILEAQTMGVSCWDQSGSLLWSHIHLGQSFFRSVCSIGLRRLYVLTNMTRLDCLDAASGKVLHSVKLYDNSALKEVSTMAQDAQDRILINNLEDIVCFDWI